MALDARLKTLADNVGAPGGANRNTYVPHGSPRASSGGHYFDPGHGQVDVKKLIKAQQELRRMRPSDQGFAQAAERVAAMKAQLMNRGNAQAAYYEILDHLGDNW